MTEVLVIGVGNAFRGDDGAGLEVARLLRPLVGAGVRVLDHDGEPPTLLLDWEGAETVYVIDAVRAQDPPGTIHRVELDATGEVALPVVARRESSHALGLGEAVALARALDRLPRRLVLFGIAGTSFRVGEGLADHVRQACEEVAAAVAAEIADGDGVDDPRPR